MGPVAASGQRMQLTSGVGMSPGTARRHTRASLTDGEPGVRREGGRVSRPPACSQLPNRPAEHPALLANPGTEQMVEKIPCPLVFPPLSLCSLFSWFSFSSLFWFSSLLLRLSLLFRCSSSLLFRSSWLSLLSSAR